MPWIRISSDDFVQASERQRWCNGKVIHADAKCLLVEYDDGETQVFFI
jgi:hypothetical protein